MIRPGHSPDLRSGRLLLRAPRLDDAEAIRTLADDFEVARWMSRIPHPYRLTDALVFLEEVAPGEVVWVVDVAGEGIAGVCGFSFRAGGPEVELGYWLGRRFWGFGYATEAAGLMLGQAWASAMPRVQSGCFEGNRRSRRVLEKLGFRVVGHSTRYSLARGVDLPHLDMAVERPTDERLGSDVGFPPDDTRPIML